MVDTPLRKLHDTLYVQNIYVKDLGLALVPKQICPGQSQAFKEVNNSQAFSVRKKMAHVYLDKPLAGAPRHVCKTFRDNVRRTDCVGPVLSQI